MSNLVTPIKTQKIINLERKMREKIFHSSIALSIFLLSSTYLFPSLNASPDPLPAPWPLQLHAILFMNNSNGLLRKVDLWYDWPNGRNFNILQTQLGGKMFSLQWNNGTTFYYTDTDTNCEARQYSVGLLRPNWLDGANYLGRVYQDGFLCNVWEKEEFAWYYEDVETKRPVYWSFIGGIREHFLTFEVGKVLDDPNWQAPAYCFEEASYKAHKKKTSLELEFGLPLDPMGIFMAEKFLASRKMM